MHLLLQESPSFQSGGFVIPDFNRVRAGLRFSLQKVIDYRAMNPISLNGSNFLVKLLQSVNVSLQQDPIVYDDKVRDRAFDLSMSLRMTSGFYKGVLFTPGVFYGKNTSEILVANIDPYDRSLLDEQWRTLCPIRVLYHPQSDLNLHVPDGRFESEEPGIAVITINIPMLASQYRKWRLWRNEISDDSPRTVMQFLQEVPLPNMLYSHLDIAILNRCIAQFFGFGLPEVRSRYPFHMTDWTSNVDTAIGRYLEMADHRQLSFDQLVDYFPTVGNDSLRDVIQLPDLAFTFQMQWAVLIARLPLVFFLVRFSAQFNNQRNRGYYNYLRRYFRMMDSGRYIGSALTVSLQDEIDLQIKEGILPYLK